MRIPVYQKAFMNFLSLIVLLLAMTSVWIPTASAQDEPALIIDIYDSNNWNESAGSIVFEGRTYDITVSTENESMILGVNITVLGITHHTSLTEPYITINVPEFEESDSFVITATKEGYQTATVELAVLKGELFTQTDRTVVDEKKELQITVTDQDNKPVEGAFVYVTENATPILTDLQGKVIVYAPEVEIFTTITIQVIKNGYLPGSTTIRIENVEGTIFQLSESKFLQMLPVLLAIIVVIFSVIYVLFRNKRTRQLQKQNKPAESPEPPQTHSQKKQGFKNESVRHPEKEKKDLSVANLEPRVEEIRIPVQAKKKETTYLSEEKEQEQVSENQKIQQDEWFKGQDYMRYKIDELTGKIDLQTDGKWFEGEHDTKYKVDETLKKNLN